MYNNVYVQWPGAWFRSRSQGIWLEPEPSHWPGSGSSFNCFIIHTKLNFGVKNKLVTSVTTVQ